MKLGPFQERVKALQTAFVSVEIGAAFAVAVEQTRAYPSAWVVPMREATQPNRLGANRTRQKITATVALVYAVRGVTGAAGGAALDIMALRIPVRDGLIGWKHPDAIGQTEFAGGGVVTIADGVMWWQDNFTADFYVTN